MDHSNVGEKDKKISTEEKTARRKINPKVFFGIIILIIICGAAGILLFSQYSHRMDRNRGNTTGNINEYGFSAAKDGWVYYSEFKDNNSLIYKTNGSEKSQLLYENQANILFLNVVDSWIYYDKGDLSKRDSKGYPVQSIICRMKTDGSEKTEIATTGALNHLSVVDGWIYYSYIDSGKYIVSRMKTDGSEKTDILNLDTLILDFNVVGKYMYYLEVDNSTQAISIYKQEIGSSDKTELLKEDKLDLLDLNVAGDYIYYEKADKQTKAATIYRMKTDGSGEKEISKEDACAWSVLNVTDDWIYYMTDNQTGSTTYNSKIYRMKPDGSKRTKISDKDICISAMNIVGDWIYYTKIDQNTGIEIRKMKLDGSDDSIA